MSDASKNPDDVELIEAEGPDIEMSDDTRPDLGTPAGLEETDAARAHLEDQVRSVRSAEEGHREEPATE